MIVKSGPKGSRRGGQILITSTYMSEESQRTPTAQRIHPDWACESVLTDLSAAAPDGSVARFWATSCFDNFSRVVVGSISSVGAPSVEKTCHFLRELVSKSACAPTIGIDGCHEAKALALSLESCGVKIWHSTDRDVAATFYSSLTADFSMTSKRNDPSDR
jgi:hypothetical protein